MTAVGNRVPNAHEYSYIQWALAGEGRTCIELQRGLECFAPELRDRVWRRARRFAIPYCRVYEIIRGHLWPLWGAKLRLKGVDGPSRRGVGSAGWLIYNGALLRA